MFNEEELLHLRKLMVQADFEIYDSQPEHIRNIIREHGVSVAIAKMIYREEMKNVQ